MIIYVLLKYFCITLFIDYTMKCFMVFVCVSTANNTTRCNTTLHALNCASNTYTAAPSSGRS